MQPKQTESSVPPGLQPPAAILVRGVNWLGDAVMTTAALQRLRERFPDARLALLTSAKLAELYRAHPSLDEVLTFAEKESPLAIGRRLRRERFDAALVLPNSPRSALEVWLAGIPRRVGYAQAWRSWLLTQPVPPRPGHVRMRKRSDSEIKSLTHRSNAETVPATLPSDSHQLHDFLHLAAALGANPEPLRPRLEVTAEEIKSARAARPEIPFPSSDAVPNGDFPLGLTPAAAYGPAKRWPAENFAAVVREISRSFPSVTWLAFGGPDDSQLCDHIGRLAGTRFFNLAGKTSLRELMTWLKICRLLLTNDSGPMHLAAAMGTPVVALFGSTSPELTGPGLPGDPRHQILRAAAPCSPCFRRACPIDFRCMTGITVDRVVAAVRQAVAMTKP